MLSPPVTLTLLRKPTTAENYCTALRSVRIIFFFFLSLSSPSLFPLFSFAPPSYARHPPLLSISAFDLRSLETRTFRIGAERERERERLWLRKIPRENSKFYQPALEDFQLYQRRGVSGARFRAEKANAGVILRTCLELRTLSPFVGGVSGAISRLPRWGCRCAKWGRSVQVHVTRTKSKPWTWSSERTNEETNEFFEIRVKWRNLINLSLRNILNDIPTSTYE